jgi:hypothetical protein
MGAKMKTSILIIFLFASLLAAQEFDSTRIGANRALVVKENKILTFSIPNDGTDLITTQYYDGKKWNNISQDTMPTIHLHNSRCSFSNYSDHLYVAGQYHLWEFDGKEWIKHAIYDSLYHQRRFEGIVALPDSSLIITAFTQFITGQVGNTTLIGKIYHEVLKFKNGTFTTVRSRWTYPSEGIFEAYQKLKVNKDGTYSFFTMDESDNKWTWELVTYNSESNIVSKHIIPDFKKYGFINLNVEINDYLFDSKGSLWLLTKSGDNIVERDENGETLKDSNGRTIVTIDFIGLVEITNEGNVFFYNNNIGIERSVYRPESFTIDDNDNIWFFYTYRILKPGTFLPSLYQLHSDRQTLTEYKQETILEYSKIYNGGNVDYQFKSPEYRLLVFDNFNKSLFATRGGTPLLQFFPEKVPTSVWDRQLIPVELYPNPVPNGKNVVIVSTAFDKQNGSVKVYLRDISGATVREEVVHTFGNQVRINTEGLIRGTYFVSVLSNNNLILQTSFVKE